MSDTISAGKCQYTEKGFIGTDEMSWAGGNISALIKRVCVYIASGESYEISQESHSAEGDGETHSVISRFNTCVFVTSAGVRVSFGPRAPVNAVWLQMFLQGLN